MLFASIIVFFCCSQIVECTEEKCVSLLGGNLMLEELRKSVVVPRKKRTPRVDVEVEDDLHEGNLTSEAGKQDDENQINTVETGNERKYYYYNSRKSAISYCIKEEMEYYQTRDVILCLPKLPHCKACNVHFRVERLYVKHQATQHQNYRPYKCRVCGKAYKEKSKLTKHICDKHGNFPDDNVGEGMGYKYCFECRRKFPSVKALEKHGLQFHPKEKLMVCPFCSASYKRQNALSRHVRDMHVMAVLRCKFCCNNFERSDDARKHQNICKKRRRRKEKYGEEDPNVATPDYEFFLKEASDGPGPLPTRSFDSEDTSNVHHYPWHGGGRSVITSKRYMQRFKYTCALCGGEFESAVAYEEHGATVHRGEKIFHCGDCSVGFVKKCNLLRHVRETHGNYGRGGDEFEWPCGNCSATFKRRDVLTRHEFSCHVDGRHIDDQVEKRRENYCGVCRVNLFTSESAFQQHIRGHENYVQCPGDCRKMFHKGKPTFLVKHMMKYHPDLNYELGGSYR